MSMIKIVFFISQPKLILCFYLIALLSVSDQRDFVPNDVESTTHLINTILT